MTMAKTTKPADEPINLDDTEDTAVTVTLSGVPYGIIRNTVLTPVESGVLLESLELMKELVQAKPSDQQRRDIETLLDEIVGIVLLAPAAVRDKLSVRQKRRVLDIYVSQPIGE